MQQFKSGQNKMPFRHCRVEQSTAGIALSPENQEKAKNKTKQERKKGQTEKGKKRGKKWAKKKKGEKTRDTRVGKTDMLRLLIGFGLHLVL